MTTTHAHAVTLQKIVSNLIDISLVAKQAHWNIRGRGFYSLHLFLDEVVNDARSASDELAEYMASIGVPALGNARSVARDSTIEQLDDCELSVPETWAWVSDVLSVTARDIREELDVVDDDDPIAGDLLIGIVKNLELKAWMARMEAA